MNIDSTPVDLRKDVSWDDFLFLSQETIPKVLKQKDDPFARARKAIIFIVNYVGEDQERKGGRNCRETREQAVADFVGKIPPALARECFDLFEYKLKTMRETFKASSEERAMTCMDMIERQMYLILRKRYSAAVTS